MVTRPGGNVKGKATILDRTHFLQIIMASFALNSYDGGK
jgi:hypothetical protein